MEDQRPVGGIGDLAQQGRVVLAGLDDESTMDIGVDVRRHLREVACPPRLGDHGGEIAEVAGLHGQGHLLHPIRQPVGASRLDFFFSQEADHGVDLQLLELRHIAITHPRKLTRAIDLAPPHRAAIGGLVTADVPEVGLAVEGNVPFRFGRRWYRSWRGRLRCPTTSGRQHHEDHGQETGMSCDLM